MIARKENGIGSMVFKNPWRHNAVSLEMWDAANEIGADFQRDDAVRVVVVRGAREKAFVAGADIPRFDDKRAEQETMACKGRDLGAPMAGCAPCRNRPSP